MKKHKLFYQCLLASLTLHLGAVWVFYTKPLFLQPVLSSIFGKNTTPFAIPFEDEDIALSEKNVALEEVFNQMIVLSPAEPQDYNHFAFSAGKAKRENLSKKSASDLISNLPPSLRISEVQGHDLPTLALPSDLLQATLALENHVSSLPRPYSYERAPSSDWIRELEKKLPSSITANPLSDSLPNLTVATPPLPSPATVQKASSSSHIETVQTPPEEWIALTAPGELAPQSTPLAVEPERAPFLGPIQHHPQRHQEIAGSSLPPLTSYALPSGSTALEWSDDFSVEIKTLAQEEGGYLFSLTFVPKYDMSAKRMAQNYTFLIDRTNSVEKHRYQTFKRGVSKALLSLREGDKFNIAIFDTKIARLSPTPIPYSKKSLQMAEDFLEKQSNGNFSAASDIYRKLSELIPTEVAESEENSVILISDGDSPLNAEKQRKLIRTFLENSKAHFTLYTATAGQGNNLAILDFLSALCRGSMLYADTHTSFPRKLAKLVINLRYPIAKELMLTLAKVDPESHLQIFPSHGRIPTLFNNQPFTIFGKSDKLSDFTLLLQGRNGNQLLTLKKKIDLSAAKTQVKSLEKEWKRCQAHFYYDQYLEKGNISFLEKAKDLISYDKPARHQR